MKKWVCIAVVTMVIGFTVISEAEDIERRPDPGGAGHGRLENQKRCAGEPGHHRGGGRGSAESMPQEAMMINALRIPRVAQKIGLNEEQRKKIEHKLEQLQDNHLELKYKMKKAAMKQARLITAKELDEEALMDVIEETGRYRTQMAKQRIKLIIFMRETLTPDQIKTMQGMMRERMNERRKMYRRKQMEEGEEMQDREMREKRGPKDSRHDKERRAKKQKRDAPPRGE